MASLVCISDFREEAFQILDRNAREYYRSGADDEITLKDNVEAYNRWIIRPRMLRDVSIRSLTTTVLGKPVAFPLGVSPTAMQKMAHPEGEVANAKAAAAMGTIFTLATMSTCTIEEVAAATPSSRKWFQLYIYKDRNLTMDLVRRAEAAGFEALVFTVDSFLFGKKRATMRKKFVLPPLFRMANFDIGGQNAQDDLTPSGYSEISEYVAGCLDPSIAFHDLAWLKKSTRLPVLVKGILTSEDAILALDNGADGIFVSNHGGRQLDTVTATIEVLPEIVSAVDGRCEVFVDCGVSKGSDVFKAIALGAKMVFAGRSLLWGLAVGGEEGAKKVLQTYRDELDLTMALAGVCSVDQITKDYVARRSQL